MAALTARTDKQNEERVTDIAGLRTRLATDSAYMEALASKTMGVFFSAYRSDHVIMSCNYSVFVFMPVFCDLLDLGLTI